ncbi:hypothetical protein KOR34_00690 [Posidoniimonas corsicana]|uniref:Uncharacterized protein n=1 Tax=Posidoniimonas corsicana TaxID=1938618 RepID=A0A5C5VA53_9BACT|nr:hypothetical protein [Posidoniimonas corsicana]TWT35181.1 hypothetical protein KOR34_00690 [Posidoniimonas corsicana]
MSKIDVTVSFRYKRRCEDNAAASERTVFAIGKTLRALVLRALVTTWKILGGVVEFLGKLLLARDY